MKLQTAVLKATPYRFQYIVRLAQTGRMDDRIVRVASELDVGELPPHPFVERVMHEKIREQGAYNTTLRRTFRSLYQDTVLLLSRDFQPPLDVKKEPWSVRMMSDSA